MDRTQLWTPAAVTVLRALRVWTPEQADLYLEHGIAPVAGGAVDADTILYDVHDCKVYPLTADSGASPTYGTGVDVPGIAQVGINPNIIANELKGDAKVIDRRARIDSFPFTATYGKLSMDVLDVILEGVRSDVTEAGIEKARFDIEGGNEPPYFGIAVQFEDTDVDVGMVRVMVYKAKITGGTLITGATDTYGQPTIEASGIATEEPHNKMIRVEIWDTEQDLPTNVFPA